MPLLLARRERVLLGWLTVIAVVLVIAGQIIAIDMLKLLIIIELAVKMEYVERKRVIEMPSATDNIPS